jgi:hydroxymethylglutaryl-CoA synthase
MGKRIVLFSYGSGLASTMFSFHVAGSLEPMANVLIVRSRLSERTIAPPTEFEQTMKLREHTHNKRGYAPVGEVAKESMWPGTYYLEQVDEKFRRKYGRF